MSVGRPSTASCGRRSARYPRHRPALRVKHAKPSKPRGTGATQGEKPRHQTLAAEAEQAGKMWRLGGIAGPAQGSALLAPLFEAVRGVCPVEGQDLGVQWPAAC